MQFHGERQKSFHLLKDGKKVINFHYRTIKEDRAGVSHSCVTKICELQHSSAFF